MEAALPGRLADNVMHFARVLRSAGMPVGTDRVLLSFDALRVAGIGSRGELRAVLASCLLSRHEQRPLFDQAFDAFWRDPDLRGKLLQMLLPQLRQHVNAPPRQNRRLSDALYGTSPSLRRPAERPIELDVALSASDQEQLRKADFDQMSAAEWSAAQRMLERLPSLIAWQQTRRTRASARGRRLDLRAMLRSAAREGGECTAPQWRERRRRAAPIVVLVDISGSMSRYSRMFLHFLHALLGGRRAADHRVHAFVFGTRLTHVTRQIAQRDPDAALDAVVDRVEDWSGGTRIAHALAQFNRLWARRVLSNSPTVVLITDGLERGSAELLAHEAERLSKSCKRLLWLNPLLRYTRFQPRAAGVAALLPHVDEFLPMHNIDTLDQLIERLKGNARGKWQQ